MRVDKYLYTSAVLFVLCQKQIATSTTLALWNYLLLRDSSPTKLDEITLHTTLSKKAINRSIKILIALGVVERERDSVTTPYVYRIVPLKPRKVKGTQESTPPYYSYNYILDNSSLTNILGKSLASKFNNIINPSGSKESTKSIKRKGVRVKDILSDSDWSTVKKVMSKYYTERELIPTDLVYRNRWMRLCVMLYDEDFNFKLYAEWYKSLKYDRVGFAWGLYTSKSMREEFQNQEIAFVDRKDRKKRRLNTTSKWKETSKSSISNTKSFLKNLEDIDENE